MQYYSLSIYCDRIYQDTENITAARKLEMYVLFKNHKRHIDLAFADELWDVSYDVWPRDIDGEFYMMQHEAIEKW